MIDSRVKRASVSNTNKCRDCKYAKRVDRYSISCYHPIWQEDTVRGSVGCSPRMGNSTCACKHFEHK